MLAYKRYTSHKVCKTFYLAASLEILCGSQHWGEGERNTWHLLFAHASDGQVPIVLYLLYAMLKLFNLPLKDHCNAILPGRDTFEIRNDITLSERFCIVLFKAINWWTSKEKIVTPCVLTFSWKRRAWCFHHSLIIIHTEWASSTEEKSADSQRLV